MIKKKKIRIPAASNGLLTDEDQNKTGVDGFLGFIPLIIDLTGQTISAGMGNGSVLSNALGMAGTGASIGSTFGPLGAGIGAAAGATIGTLARGLSGGRDAEMTSFTDFDEGELAGFLRPGKRRELKRLRRHYAEQAYANKAAVEGTGQLLANYNLEYGNMGTNTFANGGITNSLAYVDDGELISTPDGLISKVPELGRPTDSNLVSLPEGSRILSDKLKVPGTKKTFALLGEEMMTTKKSKFNDKYAENAAKLNEMNNKSIHDLLFEILEIVKAKKGIKRKYKDAVVAADLGDVIPYTEQPRYSKRYLLRLDGTLNFTANPDEVVNIGDTVMYKSTPYVIRDRYTTGNSNHAQWLAYPLFEENGVIDIYMPPKPVQLEVTSPTNYSRPMTVAPIPPTEQPILQPVRPKGRISPQVKQSKFTLTPDTWINDPAANAIAQFEADNLNLIKPIEPLKLPEKEEEEENNNKPDYTGIITNALSSLAGLAPIIDNLSVRPEYQDPNYNPYSRAIMTTMRNRRFDIAPAMRDIERNRAISNYDAALMNTNTGANLAFRLLNASNANRAIADIRSQESNVNNAYLGEYAKMLNNLGQQWAAETTRVDDANMANRALARNIRRAGLSGLSQWAQNRELMRNQLERDNAMLLLYRDFLAQGFSNNTVSNWDRYIERGGNR